jgi:hypothetical protein
MRPDGGEKQLKYTEIGLKIQPTRAVPRWGKPNPEKFLGAAAGGVRDHAGAGDRFGQNRKPAHRLRIQASCFATCKMKKIYLDRSTRSH